MIDPDLLTPDHPDVRAFLAAWHENGRASFEAQYDRLNYDEYYQKTAKQRTRFLALDKGSPDHASGVFLVDRQTHDVWSIKGYGVPNRRIGTLQGLTRAFEAATAAGRELPRPGYKATDLGLVHAIGTAAAARS
jgi:hypothetical protein